MSSILKWIVLLLFLFPCVIYAFQFFGPRVNFSEVVFRVDTLATDLTSKYLDVLSKGQIDHANAVIEKAADELAGVESLIEELKRKPGCETIVRDLEQSKEKLIRNTEIYVAAVEKRRSEIDADRLAYKQHELARLQEQSAKAEIKTQIEIAQILGGSSGSGIASNGSEGPAHMAASVFQKFISAVAANDLQDAKAVSTHSFKNQINFTRLRNLRERAPAELISGFRVEEGDGDGSVTIHTSQGEKISSLQLINGEWLVASAW